MVHLPLFNRKITETPWDRFPSDTFLPLNGSFLLTLPGILLFQIPFAISFFASWSRHFPTRAEQMIWRVCAVYHAVYTLFMTAYYIVGAHTGLLQHEKLQPLKKLFERPATYVLTWLKHAGRKFDRSQTRVGSDISYEKQSSVRWSCGAWVPSRLRGAGRDLENWLKQWRNISSNQDPDMEVRLRWIIPSWTMALIYIWCRLIFYIEDFASLRQQPADVYIALNQFIPFIQ